MKQSNVQDCFIKFSKKNNYQWQSQPQRNNSEENRIAEFKNWNKIALKVWKWGTSVWSLSMQLGNIKYF